MPSAPVPSLRLPREVHDPSSDGPAAPCEAAPALDDPGSADCAPAVLRPEPGQRS